MTRPRSRPLLASLACAATLWSGCATSSGADRGAAVATGLLLFAGGLALTQAFDTDDDASDSERAATTLGCAAGGCYLAYGAVALGAIAILGGMTSTDDDEEGVDDGARAGDGHAAAAPPPTPRVHPAQLRPLPEVATDELTLRLAKQARSAALRGDCAGVARSLAEIASRDPRYHAALIASAVIDGCPPPWTPSP